MGPLGFTLDRLWVHLGQLWVHFGWTLGTLRLPFCDPIPPRRNFFTSGWNWVVFGIHFGMLKWPKTAQDGLKVVSRLPKKATISPRRAPHGYLGGPQRIQMTPRCPPDTQRESFGDSLGFFEGPLENFGSHLGVFGGP